MSLAPPPGYRLLNPWEAGQAEIALMRRGQLRAEASAFHPARYFPKDQWVDAHLYSDLITPNTLLASRIKVDGSEMERVVTGLNQSLARLLEGGSGLRVCFNNAEYPFVGAALASEYIALRYLVGMKVYECLLVSGALLNVRNFDDGIPTTKDIDGEEVLIRVGDSNGCSTTPFDDDDLYAPLPVRLFYLSHQGNPGDENEVLWEGETPSGETYCIYSYEVTMDLNSDPDVEDWVDDHYAVGESSDGSVILVNAKTGAVSKCMIQPPSVGDLLPIAASLDELVGSA